MTLVHQSVGEFVILTATGTGLLTGGALLLTDYRGFRARYVRSLKRSYQPPFFRAFVTSRRRRRLDDPKYVKRALFIPSVLALLMGLGMLVLEVAALSSGKVG
ncbi:MAG TPA: hypothetical protein VK277_12720 [Acidimicrobiales bacterium]|nr:hypothetical protein [Acidimicrobiales bacterium]